RGQGGEVRAGGLLRLPQLAALDGDEARTESVEARIVLVARRLVDRALAPKFGLQRRDGHAIRLDAAVAAALAHQLVDDDALSRIGKLAACAAPALFRRAGLVVQENRRAFDVAQALLHVVQVFAP